MDAFSTLSPTRTTLTPLHDPLTLPLPTFKPIETDTGCIQITVLFLPSLNHPLSSFFSLCLRNPLLTYMILHIYSAHSNRHRY